MNNNLSLYCTTCNHHIMLFLLHSHLQYIQTNLALALTITGMQFKEKAPPAAWDVRAGMGEPTTDLTPTPTPQPMHHTIPKKASPMKQVLLCKRQTCLKPRETRLLDSHFPFHAAKTPTYEEMLA